MNMQQSTAFVLAISNFWQFIGKFSAKNNYANDSAFDCPKM